MTVQSTRWAEHKLNRAICDARISEGYKQYLEILNVFYADDVEVSTEGQRQPVYGKAAISALVERVLVPLHILAEVGSLAISVRHTPIPSDSVKETSSSWRLDLVGTSGKTCTVTWSTLRKWNGYRVGYERHYDIVRTGEPLSVNDIRLDVTQRFPGSGKGFLTPFIEE